MAYSKAATNARAVVALEAAGPLFENLLLTKVILN